MLLGADASVEPIKPVLIARTGGNPLFLEESVRTLVETRALVGERGREVLEFVEDSLGEAGLKRSVVVCATSDQPSLVRLKASSTIFSALSYSPLYSYESARFQYALPTDLVAIFGFRSAQTNGTCGGMRIGCIP